MAASKNPIFDHDNVFAYLRWRGDLTFTDAHFCEVDNLILSMVCYLNFEGLIDGQIDGEPVLLSEAVSEYAKRSTSHYLGAMVSPEMIHLAHAVVASRRFRHTKVVGFTNEVDEEKHIQFCAMTYLLPDGSLFVAYRGTDDNIIGWKEDFMLAFTSPVPAQIRAVEYLEKVAEVFPVSQIRLGGHSKGGNLAFYAAACATPLVQHQIVNAYSNDGPGFLPEFFATEGYLAIEKRLVSFVPQSSIVGALLHSPKHYHVIHSTQKTVLQHDPFSWTVVGPHFRHMRTRSAFGVRADVTIDRWLAKLTMREREAFIQRIFGLISDSGAKTLTDIVSSKLKSIRAIITSFTRLEKQDRDMMFRIMHQLLRASHESMQLMKQLEEYTDSLLEEHRSTKAKQPQLKAAADKTAKAEKEKAEKIAKAEKDKANKAAVAAKKEKEKAEKIAKAEKDKANKAAVAARKEKEKAEKIAKAEKEKQEKALKKQEQDTKKAEKKKAPSSKAEKGTKK